MKKQEYAKANKEWLLEKTKEEGGREIPGGIYYKVLKEGLGDGRHPSRRSIVTAHYTGRTINGKKFDSSLGGVPLAVRLCGPHRWMDYRHAADVCGRQMGGVHTGGERLRQILTAGNTGRFHARVRN